MAISQSCMDNLSFNSGFLLPNGFSDDCVFHDSGFANTQKTHIWGTESPRDTDQYELQKQKYHSGVLGMPMTW